jgi:hypothetical protein
MRRLIFWHGSIVGKNCVIFMILVLFKTSMHTFPLVFYNINNGLSALSMYRDFYFLFYSIDTLFVLLTFILLD